jgi:HAD superfamily hydrolase (TIGR01450 family)
LKASDRNRIAAARAIIFDMDGTLVLGSAGGGAFSPLPGAVALLARLRARGTPFRVFTNGTAKIPARYATALRDAGLDVLDSEMMTPATSAADWFVRRRIKRVRALGGEGLSQPLREVGIEVIEPEETAERVEAVLTGWYKEFTLADMERACRDIWAGAMLTTSSNVPFFATAGGRSIGHSFAINAAIRSLTEKRARILGKPSREAMACALRRMGLPASAGARAVVVGDDPALEMRLAKNSGAMGIAVTTGILDRAALSLTDKEERPDLVLDSLEPILEALD